MKEKKTTTENPQKRKKITKGENYKSTFIHNAYINTKMWSEYCSETKKHKLEKNYIKKEKILNPTGIN